MISMNYRLSINNYDGVTLNEARAINDYFYEKDTEYLESVIRSGLPFTDGFTLFLADFVCGRIKRPVKKRSKYFRNFDIYNQIAALLNDGYVLTSSRKDGAAAIVGERFNVTEDVAIKVYQFIKKKFKEDDIKWNEEHTYRMQNDPSYAEHFK